MNHSIIEKSQVALCFAKANQSYAEHAIIQKKIAFQLMQFIEQHLPNEALENVFEIGCGTGNLSHLFIEKYQYKNLFLNDLYADVQQHFDVQADIQWHIGDAEHVHFPKKLDLIMSSSALQWMTDLDSIFQKSAGALNEGGLLCFSTFGQNNLKEIKALTARGLDYLDRQEIQAKLIKHGFELVHSSEHINELQFNHPKYVLQHLKATGVTATAKKHRWTKQSLANFYLGYRRFIATDAHENLVYPLSYHPIYVIARRIK